MKIEDVIVKIKLADEEQKAKGILAFGKIRIPVEFNGYGKKYIVIKGFIVWGNSEYPDGIKGYCSVTVPSIPKPGRKPFKLFFVEDENFKQDISFWREFTTHILRSYYREINQL